MLKVEGFPGSASVGKLRPGIGVKLAAAKALGAEKVNKASIAARQRSDRAGIS
jgi:hypothetical protein